MIQELLEYHNILLPDDLYTVLENDDIGSKLLIKYNTATILYLQNKTSSQSINISGENIEGNHLLRLISSILGIENSSVLPILDIHKIMMSEILLQINKILTSGLYNYCTICGKKSEIQKIKVINTCTNEFCKIKYFHAPTDNIISDNFKSDSKVVSFLIQTLVACTSHPKVDIAFKPLPKIIGVNNPNDFISLIPENFKKPGIPELFENLSNSENDLSLYKNIGEIPYAIIKNSLSSNYFSLVSTDDVIKDKSIVFINVNHSAESEKKFQNNHQFLFHGSQLHSWYPIIKNGLKVLSGTALQANGAAYGQGIYFSDSFEMSLSYSNRKTTIQGFSVVGVFQISEDINIFKKTSGIFVIPDDTKLLLKSIVFVKNYTCSCGNQITNYFTKEIPIKIKVCGISSKIVKNKRLANELKLIEKKGIYDINIIDELTKWEITFLGITIHLNFANYPIKAPNIVLISGNLPDFTKDKENNIRIPIIHPNSWLITNNLLMVLEELRTIVC